MLLLTFIAANCVAPVVYLNLYLGHITAPFAGRLSKVLRVHNASPCMNIVLGVKGLDRTQGSANVIHCFIESRASRCNRIL